MSHIETTRQRHATLRDRVQQVFGFDAADLFWAEVDGACALLDRHTGLALTWRAGLLACPAYWGWFLKKWRDDDATILRDPAVTAELVKLEGPALRAAYLEGHRLRLHADGFTVWEAGAVLAEAKPYVAEQQRIETSAWLDEMHRNTAEQDEQMQRLLARCQD